MRASQSAFRNAFISNKGEEFKMDQSPKPAIHSNYLRFNSIAISPSDKGVIISGGYYRFETLFGKIRKVEGYDVSVRYRQSLTLDNRALGVWQREAGTDRKWSQATQGWE